MSTGLRALSLCFLSVALAACQTDGSDSVRTALASDAHGFAQEKCGTCHSVEKLGISPNPEAPEFPQIANQRGLTVATLTNFLRNSHNFPDEMDFTLSDKQVGELVSYVLTLQDEEYRQPM